MQPTQTDLLRLKILANSLDFEYLVSTALCTILDIDMATSTTFGNKSGSLSFFAKIGILLDMNAINKEDKKILVAYMEIRNKFMHDLKSTTFVNCFKTIESTGNYIIRKYKPAVDLEQEAKYDFCFNQLAKESADIIVNKVLLKASDSIISRNRSGRDEQKLKNLINRIKDAVLGLEKNDVIIQSNISKKKVFELQKTLLFELLDV